MNKRFSLCAFLIVLGVQSTLGQDLTAGLLHYWRFDGNTADSIQGANASLTGRVDWVGGVEGAAIKLLDRAYLTVSDYDFPFGNSQRTISVAAKLEGKNHPEIVFSYGEPRRAGHGLSIVQKNSGIGVEFGDNTFWGSEESYTGWVQIVVVVPDWSQFTTDASVYINGYKVNCSYLSGRQQLLGTSFTGSAYVGTNERHHDYLSSSVDELRIYNRALSDAEIASLYQQYKSVIERRGDKGWSPLLSVVPDGERRVLKIVDWAGGEGEKPEIPADSYLGASGFTTLENAIDIRGSMGESGPIGPQGPKGDTGATGATGPEGPQGPVGLQGIAGLQGPAGEAGPSGPAGPAGPTGPQALRALKAPQGPASTPCRSPRCGGTRQTRHSAPTSPGTARTIWHSTAPTSGPPSPPPIASQSCGPATGRCSGRIRPETGPKAWPLTAPTSGSHATTATSLPRSGPATE